MEDYYFIMNYTTFDSDHEDFLLSHNTEPWEENVYDFLLKWDEEEKEEDAASVLETDLSSIDSDWDSVFVSLKFSNYNGFSPAAYGSYGSTRIVRVYHFSDSDDDDDIEEAINNTFMDETINNANPHAINEKGPGSLVMDLEYDEAFTHWFKTSNSTKEKMTVSFSNNK